MSTAFCASRRNGVKPVVIDEHRFWDTFKRTTDNHDEIPSPVYLDLVTGAVCPDLAAQRFWRYPSRYSPIYGLSHGEHREALCAFLDSDWTGDPATKAKAKAAYSPSVARWLKNVNDPEIAHAFFLFRDDQVKRRLVDSLRRLGVEVRWK